MSPINKIEIVTYLSNRDKLLSEIIYLTKPVFKTKQADDEFTSLIKTVIGQQLSGSAAKTIISRVEKIFSSKKFYPNKINSTDDHLFRKCGMSYSKINYISII